MAMKTNDARTQQVLGRDQSTGKLALRLLTVAQTQHVVAAASTGSVTWLFALDKSAAE